MSDLQKRHDHTPRKVREQRAYRLVIVGSVAGLLAVVGILLALVGVIGAGLPVIALIVAVVCALMFRRVTSA